MINPVKKQSVSELVFEQLKDQIIRNEWPAGTKIPSENELSQMMGVSRISVRQAIQRLAVLGLIETKQADGSYVREISLGPLTKVAITPEAILKPHTLNEVFGFRRSIEIEAAAIAAEEATEEQIIKLREIYERQSHAGEKIQVKDFAELDMNFHMAIAECTNNSLIVSVYEVLWDVLSVAMEQTVSKLGFSYAKKYHKMLLETIEKHDSQGAASVMRAHLEENKKVLIKELNPENTDTLSRI